MIITHKIVYIFSATNEAGDLAYFRSNYKDGSNASLTKDVNMAYQFEIDTEKEEMVAWLNKAVNSYPRTISNIQIIKHETTSSSVDYMGDLDWLTQIRRSGVAKLNNMEIEALGLEMYEIERRLAQS